jgi:hypothetical protein
MITERQENTYHGSKQIGRCHFRIRAAQTPEKPHTFERPHTLAATVVTLLPTVGATCRNGA